MMLRYLRTGGSTLTRQIKTVFDPNDLILLREKSVEVQWPLTPKIHNIIKVMFETIQEKGVAAGLAAPQIGFKQRIILCSFDRTFSGLEVMINPRYEPIDDLRVEAWEGCFSVPRSVAMVDRWHSIKAFYSTPMGDRVNKVLEGKAAGIFQHECGHLEGELISDIAKVFKTFENEQAYQDFLAIIRGEDAKIHSKLKP